MAPRPRLVRAPVVFDAEAWAEDLQPASGREVAVDSRARLEREGQPVSELRACDAEGRDGTRLAGCLKVYLPPPAGPWGFVFLLGRSTDGGPARLEFLAFGLRHPPEGTRRPSVYAIAHRRLHGRVPHPPAG